MLEMLCGFMFVAVVIVLVLYYPLLLIMFGVKCYMESASDGDYIIDIEWCSKYSLQEDGLSDHFSIFLIQIFHLAGALVSSVYFLGFCLNDGIQQTSEFSLTLLYNLGTHLTIPVIICIALFGLHNILKMMFVFKRKLEDL